jgi:hypothetical protein
LSNFIYPEDVPKTAEGGVAEFPDRNTHPKLYEIESKHIVHTHCIVDPENASCVDQTKTIKKCEKRFPKPFAEETTFDNNKYPVYRRRTKRNVVWNIYIY